MAIDDSDNCPHCANGMSASCPYWSRVGKEWVHDMSGIKGYTELIVSGHWEDLPKTPEPDGPDKKGKGKKDDDDDDKYPRKKRFGLW